jgi:diguanylate cyclase (GGDEF)-like protein
MQMRLNNRWQKAMLWILGVNAVLQVVSAAFGWMVVIDGQNRYTHGPLFPVYLCVCFAIYLLLFLQFTIYGQSYQRQNRTSLYAVMLLVMAGIGMQELLPDIRTAYLGMTIGAALMFIHYTEFSQLTADSHIARQEQELQTDPLTGLLNRYAYSQALRDYASSDSLPEVFAAFAIDINDLKRVNDTIGHEAGDELIKAAAECLKQVFDSSADCFRTGGDEFVVLAPGMDEAHAEEILSDLKKKAESWTGAGGQKLSLAAGYALVRDNPDLNAEELVRKSDLAMYAAKAQYYQTSGHDRRRRR